MQIHELDTYIGTPSETDFMAVDDGTETFKIPLPNVGVSTQMTLAEAEAGTVTEPRVISPAVFKSAVDSLVEAVAALTVVTGTKTQSVVAGTAGSFYVTLPVPSGYRVIGVVGFNVSYSECSINTCEWTGSSVLVQVRNNYSAQLNVTVTVKALCAKEL